MESQEIEAEVLELRATIEYLKYENKRMEEQLKYENKRMKQRLNFKSCPPHVYKSGWHVRQY